MKLLIDPHGDDAALFAAYTCIAEKPHVIVTSPTVPQDEIIHGIATLGCTCELWDGEIDGLHSYLWNNYATEFTYAPAVADEGHEDHNVIGQLAKEIYGSRYVPYLTYAPRGHRDRNGTEVIPPPGAVAKKLRALSCYESQIEQESTRPWFTSLLDLREWLA